MPGFTEAENRILKKYISDRRLCDSLISIRRVMEYIWVTEAPRIVDDYTDHGVEHSQRVAALVENLLKINPNMEFSEQEIYLLLAGIYLHDIGMQCDVVRYPEVKKKAEELGAKFENIFTAKTTSEYSLDEQNEIRKNHHILSAAWIDQLHEGNDPILSEKIRSVPGDLVEDLMDICKFHSKLQINKCPDYFKHNPKNRKKMVAALLCFADELDISTTRVNFETVKIYSIRYENSVYWWLHKNTKVDVVDCNKVLLKIILHPKDFELYGSLIHQECITKFKDKNQPVLDVLVGQNIPVVIDSKSGVVADKHVEKFPTEIAAIFDKKLPKDPAETHSILFSGPSLEVGKIHWYLLKAHTEMVGRWEEKKENEEKCSVRNASEMSKNLTDLGKEAKHKEIKWWVSKNEDSIDELSDKTKKALDNVVELARNAKTLKSKYYLNSYQEMIEEIKTFTEAHSEQIHALYEYIYWLYNRNVLAPSMLFSRQVWRSTINSYSLQNYCDNIEKDIKILEKITEIALGLRDEYGYIYLATEISISRELYESDPENYHLRTIDQNEVFSKAIPTILSRLTEYFQFIRFSLEKICEEIKNFIDRG